MTKFKRLYINILIQINMNNLKKTTHTNLIQIKGDNMYNSSIKPSLIFLE